MVKGIVAILSELSSLVGAIWRKRFSPEAELARLKERQKAVQEMERTEAKRLTKAYKRIAEDKGGTDEEELARLNRRRK